MMQASTFCADCGTMPHDVKHLFDCPAPPTTMIPSDDGRRPGNQLSRGEKWTWTERRTTTWDTGPRPCCNTCSGCMAIDHHERHMWNIVEQNTSHHLQRSMRSEEYVGRAEWTTSQERNVLMRLYFKQPIPTCTYVNKHVLFLNRVLSFASSWYVMLMERLKAYSFCNLDKKQHQL